MNKGMEMPISMIIVVAVVLLVVVSVSAFFFSSGGGQMSKAEAERVFYEKCLQYCDKTDAAKNRQFAASLSVDDPFVKACKTKGLDVIDRKSGMPVPVVCMMACPSCDVSITPDAAEAHRACIAGCIAQPSTDYGTCSKNCAY